MAETQTEFFDGLQRLQKAVKSDLAAKETLAKIKDLLCDDDLRREFFRQLDDPLWMVPLRESGFFDTPPTAIVDALGQKHFRAWPESDYVARMASQLPDEVMNILLNLETENWAVAKDVVRAAKEMPAEYTAQLVPKIVEFVHRDVLRHELNDIAEICANLASENQTDAAIELTQKVFCLNWNAQNLHNNRDHYWYIDGLKKHLIPAVLPANPVEFLDHFCGELSTAIKSDEFWRGDPVNDGSYLWRPAIEEHEQNRDYDVKSNLAGCIREALESSIKGEFLQIQKVFSLLDEQNLLIFKRMKIHLVRMFADQVRELATEYLINRDLFDDDKFKHEFALLAGDCFDLLSLEEQNTWYGWVESGPEAFNEDYYRTCDSEEERERDQKWWQFNKLLWVRKYLEGERLRFVEEMLAKEGEPNLAYFNVYSKFGFVRDESPIAVSDLEKKTFQEAIEAVCSWEKPPESSRFDGPTYDGLRSDFQQYCSTNPEKFSENAELLENRQAMYVRAFLQAMKEAIKSGKNVEYAPILRLCEWVVGQPLDEKTFEDDDELRRLDRDWQWTWDTVAELTQEICQRKVPVDTYRPDLWKIIKPLLQGQGGSYLVKDLENTDIRLEDFATYSLNSPQGKAMFAVMSYAQWIAKDVSVSKDGKTVIEGGFEQMPEVREVLNEKLQLADPGGFAARAVYGWKLGLLNWIDRDWLEENAAAIFDIRKIETDPKTAYGWAAWTTFLTTSQPHIDFYRILKDQFSYAVDQTTQVEENQNEFERPFDRLGEHLMVLYGQGQINLQDDDRILERLLTKAKRSIRTHALEFVGISLGNEKDKLPKEVSQRFMTLWEWYWEKTGRDDANEYPNSPVFGYWFSSGAFDEQWSLEQLEKFVELVPKPEPDSEIVKKLAEIAYVDLPRSINILQRMIDGDDENWRVYGWRDDAKKILQQAVDSEGETKSIDKEIIDRLGRRGFLEFGELLDL